MGTGVAGVSLGDLTTTETRLIHTTTVDGLIIAEVVGRVVKATTINTTTESKCIKTEMRIVIKNISEMKDVIIAIITKMMNATMEILIKMTVVIMPTIPVIITTEIEVPDKEIVMITMMVEVLIRIIRMVDLISNMGNATTLTRTVHAMGLLIVVVITKRTLSDLIEKVGLSIFKLYKYQCLKLFTH